MEKIIVKSPIESALEDLNKINNCKHINLEFIETYKEDITKPKISVFCEDCERIINPTELPT